MNKKVYLTIDDGPNKDSKEKYAFMKENNIPAILFCRGETLEKYPETAIAALKDGIIIGNHSYDHPYSSKISVDDFKEQVNRTEGLIEVIHLESGVERKHRLFRFPFGDMGRKGEEEILQEFLKEKGFQYFDVKVGYDWWYERRLDKNLGVYWTFDTEDWRLGIEGIIKKMEDPSAGSGREGSLVTGESDTEIVLMHDFEDTKDVFFAELQKLIDMGVRFKKYL